MTSVLYPFPVKNVCVCVCLSYTISCRKEFQDDKTTISKSTSYQIFSEQTHCVQSEYFNWFLVLCGFHFNVISDWFVSVCLTPSFWSSVLAFEHAKHIYGSEIKPRQSLPDSSPCLSLPLSQFFLFCICVHLFTQLAHLHTLIVLFSISSSVFSPLLLTVSFTLHWAPPLLTLCFLC